MFLWHILSPCDEAHGQALSYDYSPTKLRGVGSPRLQAWGEDAASPFLGIFVSIGFFKQPQVLWMHVEAVQLEARPMPDGYPTGTAV
jgi:hypothetical protein